MAGESRRLEYGVRRNVLQGIAGGTSLISSFLGVFVWWQLGSTLYATRSFLLACLLAALTFLIFLIYLHLPRTGVILAWLLLSGSWFAGFLRGLGVCVKQSCTTTDTLRIAGQAIARDPWLWLQIAAAVCLTLDYSELAVLQLRSQREASADPPASEEP